MLMLLGNFLLILLKLVLVQLTSGNLVLSNVLRWVVWHLLFLPLVWILCLGGYANLMISYPVLNTTGPRKFCELFLPQVVRLAALITDTNQSALVGADSS